MSDIAIRSGLEALIRTQCAGAEDVAVTGLQPISGGNSSQIWAFDACWTVGGERFDRQLILRRAAPNEFRSAGRNAEFRLMKALWPTPVPVPEMLWMDSDGRFLERPSLVMERVPGIARRDLLLKKPEMASSLPDMLGAIHAIDVARLELPTSDHPAAEQLRMYDAEIRRLEIEPMPELRLASLWLRERLPPPPERLTLVHGDFRPANILVVGNRIKAVLDWEFAHLGDPVEDIGWYLTPFYAREHFAAASWSPENFMERYERALGVSVDRQALTFWSVFAMYKLASMTFSAIHAFSKGDLSRVPASADFIVRPLMTAIKEDLA